MSELFAGKYRLKRRLGLGGMAEVWLADLIGPQGFTRQLVIKRILPHLADDENFINMFEDEARLAARLNHPHAVRVEEFGQSDGVWYLAMEYLDGGDLRDLTRRAKTQGTHVPTGVLLQMGADVANALYHAHTLRGAEGQALNLIHRDVSPHNILVTTQGLAKVVDFGIARAETNQVKTRTGMVKGKSGYMSPEQALGRDLDGRSDQFALAVVLYETALQARLFSGENDLAIMRRVVACEIPPLVAVDPDQPHALSMVLARAMERATEDRYPDCKAFADALYGCLHELGLRSGHQPVADWVKAMGAVPKPLSKLASVDELMAGSGLVEEVTRISRSRSAMSASQLSRGSHYAAGKLSSSTQHHARQSNSASPAWWPLAMGAGLLLVGVLAFLQLGRDGDAPTALPPSPDASVERPAIERPPEPQKTVIEEVKSPRKAADPPRHKSPAVIRSQKKQRSAPVKARTATKTQAKATPKATLKIKIRKRGRPQDWGLVFVDGRAIPGDNPQADLRPGRHKICVVNQEFGIAWRDSVELPKEGARVYVDMSRATPGGCP